jgi:hypothetical protein
VTLQVAPAIGEVPGLRRGSGWSDGDNGVAAGNWVEVPGPPTRRLAMQTDGTALSGLGVATGSGFMARYGIR